MTTTVNDVIDLIQAQLQGFNNDPPMYGATTTTMNVGDMTVGLSLPAQCQPQGLIEIDDELMHVLSWNDQTATASIAPWGRAQGGTTAAMHAIGSKVTVNPRYPRRRVLQAMNATLNACSPPLFGVTTGELTAAPLVWEYALPTNTLRLLHVEMRPWNTSVYDWRPVRSARIKRDGGAPMLHLPTIDGFLIAEIRYIVATNVTAFSDPTLAFTTCGLPESCVDVIMLGSIPRLVTTSELARQQLTSVEVSDRSTVVQAGSGVNAAKFYYAMYNDRLKDEAAGLRQQYPITQMRTV